MTLYRFKTFRTSYFFPDRSKDVEFVYNIYHPFGGGLSKVYWWLFKKSKFVRLCNMVRKPEHFFPYKEIISLLPDESIVSFNMGTPGLEQKISMLGLDADGRRFFAKYSSKPRTIQMSLNEINVLRSLEGTGLSPILFDYRTGNDYVFFRTSYVEGDPLSTIGISDKITDLALLLSHYNIEGIVERNGLKYCLSHGDFTPWNILVVDGRYKLIDWELAADRPLGYDLFLYVSHFVAAEQLKNEYINAREYIDRYIMLRTGSHI